MTKQHAEHQYVGLSSNINESNVGEYMAPKFDESDYAVPELSDSAYAVPDLSSSMYIFVVVLTFVFCIFIYLF